MARDIYLALGDSITAGVGASTPSRSFSFQLGQRLGKEYGIKQRVVIARNGWTARDMFTAVHMIPHRLWKNVEILTLIAGGNNLRQLLRRQMFPFGKNISEADITETLMQFENEFDPLCRLLQAQNVPRILIGTMYNPTPHYPLADLAVARLNQKIRKSATDYGFKVVSLESDFAERESQLIDGYRQGLREDLGVPFHRPIHPNDTGHLIIADAFYNGYVSHQEKKNKSQHKTARRKRKL